MPFNHVLLILPQNAFIYGLLDDQCYFNSYSTRDPQQDWPTVNRQQCSRIEGCSNRTSGTSTPGEEGQQSQFLATGGAPQQHGGIFANPQQK